MSFSYFAVSLSCCNVTVDVTPTPAKKGNNYQTKDNKRKSMNHQNHYLTHSIVRSICTYLPKIFARKTSHEENLTHLSSKLCSDSQNCNGDSQEHMHGKDNDESISKRSNFIPISFANEGK